jgi:CheY-like chemotaxis protein
MIAVSDNGTGMSPETVARAFDPFFTTKDIGQGTGLGLSQVYGFVKQSGGHVHIYSEPGSGTSVKLYLPRFHSATVAGLAEPTTPADGERGSETVLLVEDDPDVRAFSIEALGELGYTVIAAVDAHSALQLLRNHPEVDLLFTDIGLPGGTNGRQLVEQARQIRRDLRVLFTTGYARNAIIHDGRLDPGVELITKPFTQESLATRLRDILDARSTPARILLVEDEPLIRMVVVEYLLQAGFEVETAGSATAAMDKLKRIPGGADAMVVDVGLPDRRGESLIREVRAIYPDMPIIVATGMGRGVRSELQDVPRVAMLEKPYSEVALRTALRALGIVSPHGSADALS